MFAASQSPLNAVYFSPQFDISTEIDGINAYCREGNNKLACHGIERLRTALVSLETASQGVKPALANNTSLLIKEITLLNQNIANRPHIEHCIGAVLELPNTQAMLIAQKEQGERGLTVAAVTVTNRQRQASFISLAKTVRDLADAWRQELQPAQSVVAIDEAEAKERKASPDMNAAARAV